MTTDLADNATTEEINTFVEAIIEDRQGDEAQSDAQKLAADKDEQLLADEQSGKNDAAPEGEDSGDSEPQAREWLDDSLKAEVAALGITEKELADFTSREEVDRALRFFDRSALEAGRKALADQEVPAEKEPVRDEQGRFAQKEAPKDGRYEVGLDPELYDEGLIGELGKLRDHYESRLSAMEARFNEVEARAEEQLFDGYIDSLGHPDLFGVTGKESPEELQRRVDLHVAAKAHQIGLRGLGRQVSLDQSLVARVARMVFADELGKKELKDRTRKMSKQSSSRMGGGATKAHDAQEPLMAEMERLYKELEGK